MYWPIFTTVISSTVVVNVLTYQNTFLKRQIEAMREDQALLHEKIAGLHAEIRTNEARRAKCWWT